MSTEQVTVRPWTGRVQCPDSKIVGHSNNNNNNSSISISDSIVDPLLFIITLNDHEYSRLCACVMA
jgi:hypothetical protein